jgi:Gpi18-like mannosyltransferase
MVPAVSAQACQLGLSTDPVVVQFPFVALPHPDGSPTFGELLSANYSSSLYGHNIVVQYRSGSDWVYLLNFTANEVGFTVVPAGLNSGWAHLGINTIRAVSGESCISSPASFSIQIDQAAIPSDLAVYAMVALAWAAFFIVVGRWTRRFWLFLAVAAAVYLILAPFTGQRYDVYFLASSGIRILQRVNPFDPGNPPIYPAVLKWAYPPIYAVYSAISYLIYHLLTGAPVPPVGSLTWPGYLTSTYDVWEAFVPDSLPVLVFLLKLPMIASALVTGILLQRMTGKRSAAVSWLVNPLVILVSAIWGQLDPISALFAVASVYFYREDKKYHAYLFASLGAAVKVWPFLLVPLFLAHSLKKDGFNKKSLKPLAALLPPVAVVAGLYAAFGNPLEALFIFVYARGIPTYAGQFTVNGLTWQQLLVAIGSPPVPLFLILGLPLYALILVQVYRSADNDDITKWIVVSILVFYLTYNYVNPQYFYWILPFLILQGRKLATWVFTALPMLYIALAYNIYYFVSPVLLLREFSIGASIFEQLKLAYSFQSPVVFIELSAILPTLAYLFLLREELLLHGKTGSGDPESGRKGKDGQK